MILEEINLFNFRHYAMVLSRYWRGVIYAEGILLENDTLWLGCRAENGEAAGCLIGNGLDCFDCYRVMYLYVKPEYRRQGYGTALLKYLRELLPEKYHAVRFLYTSKFDGKPDVFVDFAVKNHFEQRIQKVFFVFEPKKLLNECERHRLPEFEIVPVEGKMENDAQLKELKKKTLDAVYKYNPFDDFTAPKMRSLRNQIVLVPCGDDMFRIIEKATENEAGYFSCQICEEKYYKVTTLCIHPDFRANLYLWMNVVCFVAQLAIEKQLAFAADIMFWRITTTQTFRRFGKRFGLQHFQNTSVFRLNF